MPHPKRKLTTATNHPWCHIHLSIHAMFPRVSHHPDTVKYTRPRPGSLRPAPSVEIGDSGPGENTTRTNLKRKSNLSQAYLRHQAMKIHPIATTLFLWPWRERHIHIRFVTQKRKEEEEKNAFRFCDSALGHIFRCGSVQHASPNISTKCPLCMRRPFILCWEEK